MFDVQRGVHRLLESLGATVPHTRRMTPLDDWRPAYQRLLGAVELDLALGLGPIGGRLERAWERLAGLPSRDYPNELQQQVESLRDRWTSYEPPAIANCVAQMSEQECVDAAGAIVTMLHRLREICSQGRLGPAGE
jgi:hypothetical protein